jgi:hypothetical protein
MVLVRGLGPDSATVAVLRRDRALAEQHQDVIEHNTEAEVMAGRAAIFGPAPQGKA